MQGPAAGGETGAEASVGAAQTGDAQRGGDGTTASLRSGDGAPQEAAEAGGGQRLVNLHILFLYFKKTYDSLKLLYNLEVLILYSSISMGHLEENIVLFTSPHYLIT